MEIGNMAFGSERRAWGMGLGKTLGCVAALIAAGVLALPAAAAPINYGDFSGDTLTFTDVTESSSPAEDDTPLYGIPAISGNMLSFPDVQDQSFRASANSGAAPASDQITGTLSFGLSGPLTFLNVREGGDYSMLGFADGDASVLAELRVQVWDSSAKTTLLASKTAVFADTLIALSTSDFWEREVNIDLASLGDNDVFVVINNDLQVIARDGASAFIQKKNFKISDIPEPGSLALLGVGGLALLARRRRGVA